MRAGVVQEREAEQRQRAIHMAMQRVKQVPPALQAANAGAGVGGGEESGDAGSGDPNDQGCELCEKKQTRFRDPEGSSDSTDTPATEPRPAQ